VNRTSERRAPRSRPPPAAAGASRRAATEALTRVLAEGRSLDASLAACIPESAEARDRALARELGFGVLRWLGRLQSVLDALLAKPLRSRDTDVRVALLMGLYQLLYTRVPEHAAVSESVHMVRAAGKDWATGLVNGVLRTFMRRRAELLAQVDAVEPSRLAHPGWIIEATREDWPDDWLEILEHNNERAPMALRVNAGVRSRQDYLHELHGSGIEASPIAYTSHGVVLAEARDVTATPGFARGHVSVQDGAAQLAATILDAGPGERVLDACAAPGGKTAHILELEPHVAELVALDIDASRLERVEENLERLGLHATLSCADALEPTSWWDGRAFHRILVDAPCSSLGVIRRHPDIKLHRRSEDIDSLAATQLSLLEALWPLLAEQGLLMYATCSYLARENDRVIGSFLASHTDARGVQVIGDWGRSTGHGRQILPGENAMDGFYYALLGKR
jgi:16S rRNA (cytosine967-C5)-methyltransferase